MPRVTLAPKPVPTVSLTGIRPSTEIRFVEYVVSAAWVPSDAPVPAYPTVCVVSVDSA